MSDTGKFSVLSEAQMNELKESLAYITVLIAGADGKIDEQELNWAEKLAHIRSYNEPEGFNEFYSDVEHELHDHLDELIKSLPTDIEQRESLISAKLSKLNNILPLLDNEVGHHIYTGLVSFAKHIAKASGGFLRFGSISHNEKKWINLPMIHPIILIDEEEN